MRFTESRKRLIILVSTLIVGMCSIIYELLISTVSSYFLGDSVKQFSIIIGFYMAFMGIGSWLSRFIKHNHLRAFIITEIALGLVGAFSVPACYIYFSYADFTGYNIFMLSLVGIIGCLTGLEIPLLTKILDSKFTESHGLSNILTLDYLGALVATLLFPFILIPFMGVYKSSLLFGFINIFIGFINYLIFYREIDGISGKKTLFNILWICCIAFIALTFVRSNEFISRWNSNLFKHPVIYETSSSYQNIVVTNNNEEMRLYLNGAIQFSSADEYRYHEALVHIPAQSINNIQDVLILGGGEGLAVREVLKYKQLRALDLVDLDPAITDMASKMALFRELNQDALLNEKLTIHNEDAFKWLMQNTKKYDLIIIDLPDPTNESLSKLYSIPFYSMIRNHMNERSIVVTQATSPELSPKAFWCIDKTIKESGFEHVKPYQVNIPSFGNWGFVMASNYPINTKIDTTIEMKYIDAEALLHSYYFPKDITIHKDNVRANQLDQPIILEYYLEHWRKLQSESKK